MKMICNVRDRMQDYFSRLELVRDLSPELVRAFALLWTVRPCSAGAAVALAGDDAHKVFLVLEGTVELYRHAQGKKVVLDTLVPGSIFGDLSFAHPPLPEAIHTFARALSDAQVGNAASSAFTAFLQKNTSLALPLLVQLRNQLHRYESKIRDLALSPADIRVINELIRFAVRSGGTSGDYYELKEKFTHEMLGTMVGITRETITKTMQLLHHAGFVEYTPDHRIRLNKKKIVEECLDCLKPA